MSFSDQVKKRIEEWTKPPFEPECIREIQELVERNDSGELNERFGAELEFGTGGLRGLIRNGTNGMNKYVVAMATQGLANYVKKSGEVNPSAAVAYDSRLYSREFAMETARVLASNGIRTYIFNDLRPTPQLSYAVRKFGCTTGVVITASHNPREYNGYKVYWKDGAQIISPHDEGIINEVRKVSGIRDVKNDDFDALVDKDLIVWLGKEADRDFINEVLKYSLCREEIASSGVRIVYTPLHGTGAALIPDVLTELGFTSITYVDEQMKPDPGFPTVKKPNPEEREALNMAIDYARRSGSDIVIATDPDADRMGIAVKKPDGEFEVLSGNHIGAIIEHFVLSRRKEKGGLPANGAVVKTIVTTDLQDRIAESFGMKVFNVLTGFKFIGQKMRNFDDDGDYSYVFGGEESYGYLAGTYARDKDAILSTLIIAECCAWLKNRGRTITRYLEEILIEYGYYDDRSVSIDAEGLAGAAVISDVMKKFRENVPSSIGGIKVKKSLDYESDKINDSDSSSYFLPPSNVLQYLLEDGSKVTLRPSGTEPKIKFYFSSLSGSRKETADKITLMIDDLIPGVRTFIQERLKG